MSLIFMSNNVALGNPAATVTLTHSLGVAPDFTYIAMRTNTGNVQVLGSTTQVVYLAAMGITGVACDVEVHSHHSIIN